MCLLGRGRSYRRISSIMIIITAIYRLRRGVGTLHAFADDDACGARSLAEWREPRAADLSGMRRNVVVDGRRILDRGAIKAVESIVLGGEAERIWHLGERRRRGRRIPRAHTSRRSTRIPTESGGFGGSTDFLRVGGGTSRAREAEVLALRLAQQ